MDGIHDLGGMHGFGRIDPETSEPVFNAEWERRTFGLMMAAFATGIFNVDEFRHAIERMAPAEYLTTSYYEHWRYSLEQVMLEKGESEHAELEAAWAKAAGETV